jgi:hypothetical protein
VGNHVMAAPRSPPRGHRKKARLPPSRAGLAPTSPPILGSDFFQALAAEVDLPLKVTSTELANLAEKVTEALQDAAHVAMSKLPSVSAQRREWCADIAKKAQNLSTGLGVQEDNPDGGWTPLTAIANLEPGTAKLAGFLDLKALLDVAMPSREPHPGNSQFLAILGRMTPALLVLAAVAEAARTHWAPLAQRGGSDADQARRLLVVRLREVFEKMFAREATVSVRRYSKEIREHRPGGPAIVWFTTFFLKLAELLEKCPADDRGAAALLRIARDAVDSPRGDAIATWLRDTRSRTHKTTID